MVRLLKIFVTITQSNISKLNKDFGWNKLNNSKNTEFVCAKAEEQIVKWMEKEIKPNVIFVDPPRKGCDQVTLDSILTMDPKRIVYVSCDPMTLVRDLNILNENYNILLTQR